MNFIRKSTKLEDSASYFAENDNLSSTKFNLHQLYNNSECHRKDCTHEDNLAVPKSRKVSLAALTINNIVKYIVHVNVLGY